MAPDAGVSDIETDDSPTPSAADSFSAEAVAQSPEVKAAFDRVFGEPATGEGTPTSRRRRRQSPEDQAEELEGIGGTTEADDSIEPRPEAEKEPTDEQEPEKDHEHVSDGGEKKEADEKAEEAESPTLSPLLRHAAKRAGWNDEDIDLMAKANPELADRTFQKLLDTYNAVSSQLGELGRAQAQAGQIPPQAPATPQRSQPIPRPQDTLTEIYGGPEKIEALRQTYGAELFDQLIQPLLGPVVEMREYFSAQQDLAIARETRLYMDGLEPELKDLYGDLNTPDEDHRTKQGKLYGEADNIRRGVAASGGEMSVSEALTRANLMVAGEFLAELERKRLLSKVKGRSDRITARPTQRTRPKSEDTEQSIAAAERAYSERAAELGVTGV